MSLDTAGLHNRLKRNLCFIYCGIIWLIYFPICLYGVIKFYKYRHNIILRKRHALITIHLLILMLILLIIFLPLIIIAYCNSILFDQLIGIEINKNLRWNRYGIYTFYPMSIFLLQTWYIFIWRQWLYYYDISFTRYTANKEWTQFLNPMSYKNNFFLNPQNKTNFGSTANSSAFYKIMIILFLITSSSIIIWTIFFEKDSFYLRLGTVCTTFFWCCLCLICLIILRCKTPKFDDGFYIRKEIKYFLLIAIICTIIIICDLCIDYFIFEDNTKFHVIVSISNYFLISTALFIIICMSSLWVIYKNKSSILINDMDDIINNKNKQKNIKLFSSISSAISSKTNSSEITNRDDLTLIDVLRDEKFFDLFMDHLQCEFSIEIILSLIEFIQFQRSVYEFARTINAFQYDENFIPIDDEWRIIYDFFHIPATIPKSSIVYGELKNDEIALCKHLALNSSSINSNFMEEIQTNEDENDENNDLMEIQENDPEIERKKIEFLIRSYKLYEKYIKYGGELEINLSFKEKQKLIDLMDEYNKWVNQTIDDNGKQLKLLFKLFEKSMEEMFTLLNYSFSRFKYS